MIWTPSPNFAERTLPVTMLILHYTGMKSGAEAIDWFKTLPVAIEVGGVRVAHASWQTRDIERIDRTLDGLLGFAGSEDGLRFFKTLCRHYWQIAPAETASYIHIYRDMWDSELPDAEQSNNPETL